MSTRSGTRIHKSFHENVEVETEVYLKSDRKTRSRLKENCDALSISVPKGKKKNKYVRYPSDEDSSEPAAAPQPPPARVLRNNILKDLNVGDALSAEVVKKTNGHLKEKPAARLTRRTRKFADEDDAEEDGIMANKRGGASIKGTSEIYVKAPEVTKQSKKSKKKKRKKPSSDNEEASTDAEGQAPQKTTHNKKKGGKRSASMLVENLVQDKSNEIQEALDMVNVDSTDSFYSATDSPQGKITRKTPIKEAINLSDTFEKPSSVKRTKKLNQTSNDITLTGEPEALDNPQDKTFDLSKETISDDTLTNFNATFNKDDIPQTALLIRNNTEKVPNCNNNVDMESRDQFNTTIDLPKKSVPNRLSQVRALNTTFDKLSDISNNSDSKNLNSTYDKVVQNCTSSPAHSKSSLTSSNAEVSGNITLDRSSENVQRISLTSDESKCSTENILNTTPVLIESSMETSRISEVTPKSPIPNTAGKSTEKQPVPPATPLKREGTFTKEGPNVTLPKRSNSTNSPALTAPTKRNMSLAAPGCTPYHSSCKVPPREKRVLNRTHSIEEDTTGRFSLAELSKPSKVMFCSPVDNPALNTQRKSKMIKSSMKGSNKSFLFDEKGAETPNAAGRKRSLTHFDAEQLGAKRKRLATSVDRLSRPRTCSASAKASEPSTPRAEPAAGAGARAARSKLPNFAALHQRRFQKMESLDECQERKARRAKRMLVPTGALTVLERGSPKPPEVPKSATKPAPPPSETKKPPPTLTTAKPEPLKTTNTRFGFKLNLTVNPFSIPSQIPKPVPVESEPNGPKRQKTLQSLAGTVPRKEAAKQVLMLKTGARERRGVQRDETRTVIKGVRTNRRFDLQMRSRNINK